MTKPKPKPLGSVILVFGPSGAGKTQLMARHPGKVFLLATEPGYRYVPEPVRKNVFPLLSGAAWLTLGDACRQAADLGADAIAVDSLNGLYQHASAYVLARENASHPSLIGAKGMGWDMVAKCFLDGVGTILQVAASLEATVLFSALDYAEEVHYSDRVVSRRTWAMQLQPSRLVAEVAEHAWFLDFNEQDGQETRTLYLRPSAAVHAKCRDPELAVRSIPKLDQADPWKQIIRAFAYQPKTKEAQS